MGSEEEAAINKSVDREFEDKLSDSFHEKKSEIRQIQITVKNA
jgi:hypothetical protein